MATTYILPTRTDIPRYKAKATLGERVYQFFFYWNSREEAWHFDVSDSEGTELMSGIKVVINIPLLRKGVSHDLPRGDLMAITTDGTYNEAGLNDLGGRVLLAYHDDETIQ